MKKVFPKPVIKNSKTIVKHKWMPAMYVAYYGIIEDLANKCGYALCIHGSVTRDFDLIAVPFQDVIQPHNILLDAIRSAVGGKGDNKIFDIVGHEPHGRTCYTIECGGGGYFDISFTPTMKDAIARIKYDKLREEEIKSLLKKK